MYGAGIGGGGQGGSGVVSLDDASNMAILLKSGTAVITASKAKDWAGADPSGQDTSSK